MREQARWPSTVASYRPSSRQTTSTGQDRTLVLLLEVEDGEDGFLEPPVEVARDLRRLRNNQPMARGVLLARDVVTFEALVREGLVADLREADRIVSPYSEEDRRAGRRELARVWNRLWNVVTSSQLTCTSIQGK